MLREGQLSLLKDYIRPKPHHTNLTPHNSPTQVLSGFSLLSLSSGRPYGRTIKSLSRTSILHLWSIKHQGILRYGSCSLLGSPSPRGSSKLILTNVKNMVFLSISSIVFQLIWFWFLFISSEGLWLYID